jgi:farnesyl-diphosphate farnesyltransferase
LNRVSRSFAIVIQQLGPELRDAVRRARTCRAPRFDGAPACAQAQRVTPARDAGCAPAQVCVFYLVLRGLDTVEDDMSIPDVRTRRVLRRL